MGQNLALIKDSQYFWGKNRVDMHVILSDFDVLFEFLYCQFHVKCWSIVKPILVVVLICQCFAVHDEKFQSFLIYIKLQSIYL